MKQDYRPVQLGQRGSTIWVAKQYGKGYADVPSIGISTQARIISFRSFIHIFSVVTILVS
jgi:hypothetical protein